MLKYIKVKPLAAESFGVRSMATLVETPDLKIILDPGASLGVRREYPPHPEEYKVLRRSIRRIINAARNAGYIFISHYHLSHYLPFFRDYRHIWSNRKYATELYSGKFVYMKSTTENITDSEKRRGDFLKKRIEQMNGTVVYGDYSEHIIGNTLLKISPPVPHGRISMRRGYVLMISIMYEAEKFLFAPDVLGPYDPYTLEIKTKELEDLKDIILRQRYGAIARAKDAEVFGILIGNKTGQKRYDLAINLKEKLKKYNKKSYFFIMNNFSAETLISFSFLDCLVSTACPRIAIDDYLQYKIPILTPIELDILLGLKKWDEYRFDEILGS